MKYNKIILNRRIPPEFQINFRYIMSFFSYIMDLTRIPTSKFHFGFDFDIFKKLKEKK